MAEFLSAEWVAALDAAARSSDALASCVADAPFVLEQRVSGGTGASGSGGSGSEVVYQVVLAPGGARVVLGADLEPDLVMVTDVATAAELARGERTAQTALAEGVLRVRGDLRALVARADALQAIGDVFAGVRADTTYPGSAHRARQ